MTWSLLQHIIIHKYDADMYIEVLLGFIIFIHTQYDLYFSIYIEFYKRKWNNIEKPTCQTAN